MMNNTALGHYPPYLKLLSLVIIILVTLLFTLLLGMLIAVPFYGVGVLDDLSSFSDPSNPENIPLLKFLQIVSQLGMFIFPVLIYSFLVNRNVPSYLELRKAPALLVLMLVGVVMFIDLPVIGWMVGINESLSLPEWLSWFEEWMKGSEEKALELTEAFLSTQSITGLAVNLLMMAVLPAIGEEFLFRGVVLRLFREWFKNVHVAIIISAILFSALHLQFYGFFPRMMLGILFGYLFVWTRSLWVPIFAHFLNNAAAVVVAFLANKGVINTDYDSFGATENYSFVIISFVVCMVLLAFIYFHEKRRIDNS